jgi:hypothetical protein
MSGLDKHHWVSANRRANLQLQKEMKAIKLPGRDFAAAR